jgi:hypothetical protein
LVLDEILASLEAKISSYITSSDVEERGRIADDIYRHLNDLVGLFSQRIDEEF